MTTVFLIICKMVKNFSALRKNILFAFFLVILIIGDIIVAAGAVYLAYYAAISKSLESKQYYNKNIFDIIGALFVDSFFGLIPNFFYSIFKTKITKHVSEVSLKYFLVNYGVIAGFFIIIFILCFYEVVWINLVLLLEILYTFIIFIVSIYTLREVRHRVRRVLFRFFIYFSVYAFVTFVRNIFTMYYSNHPNNSNTIENDAFIIVDVYQNAVLAVVTLLFLKDLKFSDNTDKTSGGSTSSNTTEISQNVQ